MYRQNKTQGERVWKTCPETAAVRPSERGGAPTTAQSGSPGVLSPGADSPEPHRVDHPERPTQNHPEQTRPPRIALSGTPGAGQTTLNGSEWTARSGFFWQLWQTPPLPSRLEDATDCKDQTRAEACRKHHWGGGSTNSEGHVLSSC